MTTGVRTTPEARMICGYESRSENSLQNKAKGQSEAPNLATTVKPRHSQQAPGKSQQNSPQKSSPVTGSGGIGQPGAVQAVRYRSLKQLSAEKDKQAKSSSPFSFPGSPEALAHRHRGQQSQLRSNSVSDAAVPQEDRPHASFNQASNAAGTVSFAAYRKNTAHTSETAHAPSTAAAAAAAIHGPTKGAAAAAAAAAAPVSVGLVRGIGFRQARPAKRPLSTSQDDRAPEEAAVANRVRSRNQGASQKKPERLRSKSKTAKRANNVAANTRKASRPPPEPMIRPRTPPPRERKVHVMHAYTAHAPNVLVRDRPLLEAAHLKAKDPPSTWVRYARMGKSPTDIALSQKQAEEEKKAAEKRARTLLREVQRASIPCRASRRQAARRGRGTGSQPMLDAPPDAALLSQLQMNGFASQLGVSASARILSSTSAEATAAAAAGAGGAVNPSADRNALNDIAAMLAGASTLTDPPVTTSAQHQSAMAPQSQPQNASANDDDDDVILVSRTCPPVVSNKPRGTLKIKRGNAMHATHATPADSAGPAASTDTGNKSAKAGSKRLSANRAHFRVARLHKDTPKKQGQRRPRSPSPIPPAGPPSHSQAAPGTSHPGIVMRLGDATATATAAAAAAAAAADYSAPKGSAGTATAPTNAAAGVFSSAVATGAPHTSIATGNVNAPVATRPSVYQRQHMMEKPAGKRGGRRQLRAASHTLSEIGTVTLLTDNSLTVARADTHGGLLLQQQPAMFSTTRRGGRIGGDSWVLSRAVSDPTVAPKSLRASPRQGAENAHSEQQNRATTATAQQPSQPPPRSTDKVAPATGTHNAAPAQLQPHPQPEQLQGAELTRINSLSARTGFVARVNVANATLQSSSQQPPHEIHSRSEPPRSPSPRPPSSHAPSAGVSMENIQPPDNEQQDSQNLRKQDSLDSALRENRENPICSRSHSRSKPPSATAKLVSKGSQGGLESSQDQNATRKEKKGANNPPTAAPKDLDSMWVSMVGCSSRSTSTAPSGALSAHASGDESLRATPAPQSQSIAQRQASGVSEKDVPASLRSTPQRNRVDRSGKVAPAAVSASASLRSTPASLCDGNAEGVENEPPSGEAGGGGGAAAAVFKKPVAAAAVSEQPAAAAALAKASAVPASAVAAASAATDRVIAAPVVVTGSAQAGASLKQSNSTQHNHKQAVTPSGAATSGPASSQPGGESQHSQPPNRGSQQPPSSTTSVPSSAPSAAPGGPRKRPAPDGPRRLTRAAASRAASQTLPSTSASQGSVKANASSLAPETEVQGTRDTQSVGAEVAALETQPESVAQLAKGNAKQKASSVYATHMEDPEKLLRRKRSEASAAKALLKARSAQQRNAPSAATLQNTDNPPSPPPPPPPVNKAPLSPRSRRRSELFQTVLHEVNACEELEQRRASANSTELALAPPNVANVATERSKVKSRASIRAADLLSEYEVQVLCEKQQQKDKSRWSTSSPLEPVEKKSQGSHFEAQCENSASKRLSELRKSLETFAGDLQTKAVQSVLNSADSSKGGLRGGLPEPPSAAAARRGHRRKVELREQAQREAIARLKNRVDITKMRAKRASLPNPTVVACINSGLIQSGQGKKSCDPGENKERSVQDFAGSTRRQTMPAKVSLSLKREDPGTETLESPDGSMPVGDTDTKYAVKAVKMSGSVAVGTAKPGADARAATKANGSKEQIEQIAADPVGGVRKVSEQNQPSTHSVSTARKAVTGPGEDRGVEGTSTHVQRALNASGYWLQMNEKAAVATPAANGAAVKPAATAAVPAPAVARGPADSAADTAAALTAAAAALPPSKAADATADTPAVQAADAAGVPAAVAASVVVADVSLYKAAAASYRTDTTAAASYKTAAASCKESATAPAAVVVPCIPEQPSPVGAAATQAEAAAPSHDPSQCAIDLHASPPSAADRNISHSRGSQGPPAAKSVTTSSTTPPSIPQENLLPPQKLPESSHGASVPHKPSKAPAKGAQLLSDQAKQQPPKVAAPNTRQSTTQAKPSSSPQPPSDPTPTPTATAEPSKPSDPSGKCIAGTPQSTSEALSSAQTDSNNFSAPHEQPAASAANHQAEKVVSPPTNDPTPPSEAPPPNHEAHKGDSALSPSSVLHPTGAVPPDHPPAPNISPRPNSETEKGKSGSTPPPDQPQIQPQQSPSSPTRSNPLSMVWGMFTRGPGALSRSEASNKDKIEHVASADDHESAPVTAPSTTRKPAVVTIDLTSDCSDDEAPAAPVGAPKEPVQDVSGVAAPVLGAAASSPVATGGTPAKEDSDVIVAGGAISAPAGITPGAKASAVASDKSNDVKATGGTAANTLVPHASADTALAVGVRNAVSGMMAALDSSVRDGQKSEPFCSEPAKNSGLAKTGGTTECGGTTAVQPDIMSFLEPIKQGGHPTGRSKTEQERKPNGAADTAVVAAPDVPHSEAEIVAAGTMATDQNTQQKTAVDGTDKSTGVPAAPAAKSKSTVPAGPTLPQQRKAGNAVASAACTSPQPVAGSSAAVAVSPSSLQQAPKPGAIVAPDSVKSASQPLTGKLAKSDSKESKSEVKAPAPVTAGPSPVQKGDEKGRKAKEVKVNTPKRLLQQDTVEAHPVSKAAHDVVTAAVAAVAAATDSDAVQAAVGKKRPASALCAAPTSPAAPVPVAPGAESAPVPAPVVTAGSPVVAPQSAVPPVSPVFRTAQSSAASGGRSTIPVAPAVDAAAAVQPAVAAAPRGKAGAACAASTVATTDQPASSSAYIAPANKGNAAVCAAAKPVPTTAAAVPTPACKRSASGAPGAAAQPDAAAAAHKPDKPAAVTASPAPTAAVSVPAAAPVTAAFPNAAVARQPTTAADANDTAPAAGDPTAQPAPPATHASPTTETAGPAIPTSTQPTTAAASTGDKGKDTDGSTLKQSEARPASEPQPQLHSAEQQLDASKIPVKDAAAVNVDDMSAKAPETDASVGDGAAQNATETNDAAMATTDKEDRTLTLERLLTLGKDALLVDAPKKLKLGVADGTVSKKRPRLKIVRKFKGAGTPRADATTADATGVFTGVSTGVSAPCDSLPQAAAPPSVAAAATVSTSGDHHADTVKGGLVDDSKQTAAMPSATDAPGARPATVEPSPPDVSEQTASQPSAAAHAAASVPSSIEHVVADAQVGKTDILPKTSALPSASTSAPAAASAGDDIPATVHGGGVVKPNARSPIVGGLKASAFETPTDSADALAQQKKPLKAWNADAQAHVGSDSLAKTSENAPKAAGAQTSLVAAETTVAAATTPHTLPKQPETSIEASADAQKHKSETLVVETHATHACAPTGDKTPAQSPPRTTPLKSKLPEPSERPQDSSRSQGAQGCARESDSGACAPRVNSQSEVQVHAAAERTSRTTAAANTSGTKSLEAQPNSKGSEEGGGSDQHANKQVAANVPRPAPTTNLTKQQQEHSKGTPFNSQPSPGVLLAQGIRALNSVGSEAVKKAVTRRQKRVSAETRQIAAARKQPRTSSCELITPPASIVIRPQTQQAVPSIALHCRTATRSDAARRKATSTFANKCVTPEWAAWDPAYVATSGKHEKPFRALRCLLSLCCWNAEAAYTGIGNSNPQRSTIGDRSVDDREKLWKSQQTVKAIKKDLPDWDACMWRNVILRLSDEALGLHKPGCKARSTPHSPPVATSRCVHVKHESNDRIAQHLLQAMLYLPRGLRERWLRGMRPHVDLWDVELTWVDWEHVMGCLHRIQNAPGDAMDSLHIRFPIACCCPQPLSNRSSSPAVATGAHENMHECHAQAGVNMHGALAALEDLTEASKALKTLSLYNVTLSLEHTLKLRDVLYYLAETLEVLALDLRTFAPSTCMHSMWVFDSRGKYEVFQALGSLKKLRNLTLPAWEEFVGEHSEVVEPLTHLQHLECVYVDSIPKRTETSWKWKFCSL